ncbi:MAG: hypothetical protein AAFY08_02890 [Planctomycetota bacterium]
MAQRDLSRHQEKIVKRYYDHHDTIQANKLGELLSELWLAETDAARARLWKRARTALTRLGVEDKKVAAVCDAQDAERLGKLIKSIEAGGGGR